MINPRTNKRIKFSTKSDLTKLTFNPEIIFECFSNQLSSLIVNHWIFTNCYSPKSRHSVEIWTTIPQAVLPRDTMTSCCLVLCMNKATLSSKLIVLQNSIHDSAWRRDSRLESSMETFESSYATFESLESSFETFETSIEWYESSFETFETSSKSYEQKFRDVRAEHWVVRVEFRDVWVEYRVVRVEFRDVRVEFWDVRVEHRVVRV